MTNNKHTAISIKYGLTQVIVAISVFASRLTFLPANIKPLGSYGFFGNPLLYGASIVAFDLFVKGLYPGFWWTYIGFAMYPVLGYLARRSRRSTRAAVLLIPLASLLFFIFSNLGVWLYWYPHTLAGLATCYLLAVPFYTRTLVGDLLFGYGYLIWKEKAILSTQLLGISSGITFFDERLKRDE